jgi:glycosyltransferase involved in cell wall biosynthesis
MKVFLVDPSMFTAPYDHALRSGLESAGADACLIGRVPRFAGEFAAAGYEPFFYRRAEAGVPGRLKSALKAAEHVFDMRRLAALCRRERPDVVHFQWTPVPLVDSLFIRSIARTSATVLTVHDTTPFNGNATSALQVLHSEGCWRKFDHLVTHTESGRQSLVDRGLPSRQISVVPHGLLSAEPSRARGDDAADGRLSILFFGQIKPYKGLDTLIDAVALLPRETSRRLRVRVRGQPYMDMSAIRAQVDAAGLADTVDFRLERIPDAEVDALFAAADVIAMPYHRIDASGVLSKALAHNVAVVASETGGFAEFLRHGENALLCKVGDAEAFAGALTALADDPALLARLRANAGRLGEATASWAEIGDRTVALYREALARRASRNTARPRPRAHGSMTATGADAP